MSERNPSRGRAWGRDELLVALGVYCRLPFGQLDARTAEIIRVAKRLGRTSGALAMKCCNFASLDPGHQARGVSGLGNTSRADRELWAEFQAEPNRVAVEMGAHRLEACATGEGGGATEVERVVAVRLVQSFFRRTVLVGYGERCAICDLGLPALLNASHIVPWSVDERRRADPTNGLCLCALHDRAFDRGYIGVTDDLKVLVSDRVRDGFDFGEGGPSTGSGYQPSDLHRVGLIEIAGCELSRPERFAADVEALAWHRECVFE